MCFKKNLELLMKKHHPDIYIKVKGKGNSKQHMLIKKYLHRECINFNAGGVSFSVNPCIYQLHRKEAIKGNMATAASGTLWESINLTSFSLIQVGFRAHLLQTGSESLWRRNCCIHLGRVCALWARSWGFPLPVLINNGIKDSLRVYQLFKGVRRSMIC